MHFTLWKIWNITHIHSTKAIQDPLFARTSYTADNKDEHPILFTGRHHINGFKMGSPGHVVAADTLCVAAAKEVDGKLLYFNISAWVDIILKMFIESMLLGHQERRQSTSESFEQDCLQ